MQRLGSAAVCLALLFCVRDSVGALSGDSAPTGPPTCVSGAKECASESLAGLELNEEEAMEAASQAHSLATSKSQKKRWTKALQMIRDEAYARDFCELRIDDGGDWELVESVPCLEQVMQGDIKKQEWKNAKNTVDLLLKLDAARHSTLKRTKTALGGVLRAKQAGALAEHRMNLKPVDKRANLSLLEFFRDYVRTETPVVLTDTMEECGHNKLKLDFLRSHCSNMSVTPKADNRAAEGWAGLEDTNETTLGAFISGLSTGETSRLYVHDESLATGCREALVSVDFKMPKYFANDYFQRMALVEGNGTLAYPMGDGRNWPSLFVGPEGTRSHLHKDQLRTHFWMAGVEGTKRWTLFREEEEFLLAPNFTIHQFGVNGADPDYETYPLARFAKGWQHVLQPGELLYIPSGAPHQVENLEGPTVALAGNYIDSYSVHKSLHDIQRNKAYGHQETNWELMRTVLENPAFDGTMDLSLDHVPWDDFEKINPQHHARLVSLDPDIWTHINAAVDTVPPEDEDQ